VVVNNAGYGHFGFIEEISEAEARAQFDTTCSARCGDAGRHPADARAGLRAHRADLQHRRHRRVPTVGIYNSSKWALEGFSEALFQEVAGFGIHVTLIEPGGYATDWGAPLSVHSRAQPRLHQQMRDTMAAAARPRSRPATSRLGRTRPPRGVRRHRRRHPPRRLLLSGNAYDIAQNTYAERIKIWSEWEQTSRSA